MTDTSTSPARADAARWEHSALRTVVELSLGLTFTAAVAFGGYAAASGGQLRVVSQVAGVLFLITLTCVVVSWFRAVERDERADRAGRTPAGVPAVPTDVIALVDAEYRR
ncbi:hypothetical protein DEI99_002770 [Curtobacterium sp. MCLR17_036]|uniref:hypothetical protein n=1 Tax=Curtobacterium sp. MCLR17_036 TaxID=2175620 RepID=UPI000DA9984A|nr:hypothetical protein [Curtobacterium sp. MCLR17_036]WIE65474.1 hypothetical protein DEI99_002770 [Curtobacterium sp. MCLR17_036]